MHAQRNDRRGNLTLAIVAAFVALVGQAIILFDVFGDELQGFTSFQTWESVLVARSESDQGDTQSSR